MADLEYEKLADEIVDATIENLGVRFNSYIFPSKEILSTALKYSIDTCLHNYLLLNRTKLFDALEVTQHTSVIDELKYRTFQTGLMIEKTVGLVDGIPEEEINAIVERNIKDDFIFQLQILCNQNRKEKK